MLPVTFVLTGATHGSHAAKLHRQAKPENVAMLGVAHRQFQPPSSRPADSEITYGIPALIRRLKERTDR